SRAGGCAEPARRRRTRCTAETQPDERCGRGQGARLSEERHAPGARDVPSRIAEQRSRVRVPRTRVQATQRFGGAEAVKQLRRLACTFLVCPARRRARDPREQRLERITAGP